jgi:hypothetical protein
MGKIRGNQKVSGECRILLDDFRGALRNLSQARESMLKLGNKFDLALIHIYCARCHVELGNPGEALPLLKNAASFFSSEGYVTPLIPLMDLWMEAEAAADINLRARETFTAARSCCHRLPVQGARNPRPAVPAR